MTRHPLEAAVSCNGRESATLILAHKDKCHVTQQLVLLLLIGVSLSPRSGC